MGKNAALLNGHAVVRLRGLKGWTQDKLATKAKVDKKTIENAESGKKVSLGTLAKISDALGVDPQQLLPSWTTEADGVSESIKRYLLSFDTFIKERAGGFVGRRFVYDALDAFLGDESIPSGYFVIEGKPGMGKSALMAQLVKTRDYRLHHFNIGSQGVNTTSQFLGNVCAKLICEYGLSCSELPPDFAASSAFLDTLLREVADTLKDDARLVVLVDALDEVREDAAGRRASVLCLPSILPPRVYFVASARDLSALRLRVVNVRRLELRGDDDSNLDNVREYVSVQARRPALKAWIAKQRLPVVEFVKTMVEKSAGNFMYLRCVLPEMESGVYADLSFTSIPGGLENYYQDHWHRMGMTAKPLPRTKLNILYCLSKARQPISCVLLADFVREEIVAVQEVLDDWRQFINAQEVDGIPRYSLYHESFRDFLFRKDIVKAAGVDLQRIGDQIADNILGELF